MSSRPPADLKQAIDFETDEEFLDAPAHANDSGRKTKRLLLDLLGRWYWIALGLVLGVLAAAYYLSKVPKRYAATSSLLIKQQTSTVMSRDQVDEIDMRSIEGLNTVAERIRRHDLLERVASRMDVRSLPGIMPPPVDWRPAWLADWIDDRAATKPEEKTPQAAPAPPALAGEMSGHVFFNDRWYGFDDGIYTAARLLEILSEVNLPSTPSMVLEALPEAHSTPELQVKTADGENHAAVARMVKEAVFPTARSRITIDGIRVEYDDGFGLARPSNTTPVVVLRFEADTPAALARIQAEFRSAISQVLPNARLPF